MKTDNGIIVLGDGLLGKEIVRQTNWHYISRKKDDFDFEDINTYYPLLHGYNTILNCIAFTETYSQDRDRHFKVNFNAVIDLVDYCNFTGKKLIHISTDYVYSNVNGLAKETDIPIHCGNWYTYTKLLSDGYVQAKSNNYLLIRTSFKPKPFPYPKAITTQWGNFDYVDVISAYIIELIDKKAEGVYNVGTEYKDIYALAIQTNPDVIPSDMVINETMPRDIGMDTEKMRRFLGEI
jgi:dTDP-4-dehydrorhamnose reductase